MSFVAIDLGASSTRYCSDIGQVGVLPNNIVILPEGAESRITPDTVALESSLEVSIVKTEGGDCEYFPVNMLVGVMADRYSTLQDRPNVTSKKNAQPINYYTAILTSAVSRLKYEAGEDITLYLAVPPIEIHEARELFKNRLVGKYKVNFPKYMGGTEVDINIVDVKCFEESFMASTSFFFNMTGVPKEQNKAYLTGTVLSLDIGASTTDIAVIKKGTYLDKSGKTYRLGGNEARDYLRDQILATYDIDLDIEGAEKCMAEGRLQRGNTFVEVRELIHNAKEALAKKLTTNMQTYFKLIGIDLNMVNAIVVSGGGSLQSQYINNDGEIVKTSEPMSYFVTQELLKISSGTDVVPYGDEARFANVKGLFIRAKVDSLKAQTQ